MRKTDYFGTFLDTLNSSGSAPRGPLIKGAPRAASAAEPTNTLELETVLQVLPGEPGSEISIVDLARTLGVGLTQLVPLLKMAETNGLVRNNRGQFSLTEMGRQAAIPAS